MPPPPSSLQSRQPGQPHIEHEEAMRWQKRRGGYTIEHQCKSCGWYFDTFLPSRDKCQVCQPVGSVTSLPTTKPAEAPQAAPNLLPAPAAGNLQLDNAQYQQFGQGYGSASNFQPDMTSTFPAGPVPDPVWGSGFGAPLNQVGFPGSMSSPPGGSMQNELYGQGYNMAPDLSCAPGAFSGAQGVYDPNGPWGQGGYNTSLDPSYLANPTPLPAAAVPDQNPYPTGAAASSGPTANDAGGSSSGLRPLLPALPEKEFVPDDSTPYTAWLGRQGSYRDAMRQGKKKSSRG
ncbi:hypothetical protein F4802DRAFT_612437 [Xylaria palmicola]|nr:hypothetical protein F4802DRAFT_612437 [Xylaria palmicola]